MSRIPAPAPGRRKEREIVALIDDTRPISKLVLDNCWYTVGENEVTAIEVYKETGQMAYVPWFKVWVGDEIAYRVNGAMVAYVEYESKPRYQL